MTTLPKAGSLSNANRENRRGKFDPREVKVQHNGRVTVRV